MENIDKLQNISNQLIDVNVIQEWEVVYNSKYDFEKQNWSSSIDIYIPKKNNLSLNVAEAKNKEQNHSNLEINIIEEKEEKVLGFFPENYLNSLYHIEKGKKEHIEIRYITFLLFINLDEFEEIVKQFDTLMGQPDFRFLQVILITKKDCQEQFNQLKNILNIRNYDYCCSHDSIESIQKNFNISSDVFGFYIKKPTNILYTIKDLTEIDKFKDYYLKIELYSSFIDHKKALIDQKNTKEIQIPKIKEAIINLEKINDLKQYYHINMFYHKILMYTNNKGDQYLNFKYQI